MLNFDQNKPGSVNDLAMAQETNLTTEPVLPGHSYQFTVTLKAPVKTGKHISYWRLKSFDGTPFGDKLWCDISVVAPSAFADSQALPIMSRPPTWCAHPTPQQPTSQDPPADYQVQLMLLEASNKRRLMECRTLNEKSRQETASSTQSPFACSNPQASSPASVPVQQHPKPASVEDEETAESGMVFPKLEKESPESSTHQDEAPTETKATTLASPSIATTATETESVADEAKEIESVADFSDSDESDGGFLTDEE